MKIYELISSMNAIENGISYLEKKLLDSDVVMSEAEVNETIGEIECLNNQYHEMLNYNVEYPLSKTNISINYAQPTVTDATKFLNEITNILSKKERLINKI